MLMFNVRTLVASVSWGTQLHIGTLVSPTREESASWFEIVRSGSLCGGQSPTVVGSAKTENHLSTPSPSLIAPFLQPFWRNAARNEDQREDLRTNSQISTC